jgi:hypothetical protein
VTGHGVYLFHADRPIGNLANPRAQARHYLGYADDLTSRIAVQLAGNAQAAALMHAFTWPASAWSWPGSGPARLAGWSAG